MSGRGDQETESWHGDPAPPAAVEPPEVPSRYELGRELGRGAFGVVYAAHDRQLDRRVALKVLQPHRRGHEVQQRLVREAQALAKLRHPAVVTVYDISMHADRVLVAMELVDGATLREWSRDRTPAMRLAACIAAGRGLAAVHAAGLVHRDFKPDNVLVGTDGQVRVADFGLARLATLDDDEAAADVVQPSLKTITQTGVVLGTLPYMPPEVLRGERADARSDQYAFAVSLVEIVGGSRPYDATTHQGYLEATARAPALGEMPKWIRAIAARALSREPGARFPTMSALLDALGRDPARRRKQVVLVGCAVVAIAGATIALQTRTEEPSCVLPAAHGAAWSGERALVVRKAFDAVAPDGSARTTVIASLDRYHQQLGVAYETACRWSATQPADMVALRAACLDRRTAELDALAEQLERADAKQVAKAVFAAQNLSRVADCESIAMMAGPVQRKPAVAEEGRQIDDQLARLKSLSNLGRRKEARSALEALLPRVQRLEHGPTEAELLIELGIALEELDAIPEAEQAFRRAIVLAQSGSADVLVASAAIQLALDLARVQRKLSEGRPWADLAIATLSRMPPTPWLEMRATFALAIIELAQDQLAEAEQHGTRAYELCKRANGEAALSCAEVLNTLGGVALKSNRLDLAFQRYDGARTLAERAVGRDHPIVFPMMSNLGSVAYARGDFARSREIRTDLGERIAKVLGPKHSRLGDLYLTLGSTLDRLGRLDEAIAASRSALEIFTAVFGPDDASILVSKLQLARLSVRKGDRTAGAFAREVIVGKAPASYMVLALEVELELALLEKRQADALTIGATAIEVGTTGKLVRNESFTRLALAVAILQRDARDPAAGATAKLAVALAEQLFAPTAAPVLDARAELARSESPPR